MVMRKYPKTRKTHGEFFGTVRRGVIKWQMCWQGEISEKSFYYWLRKLRSQMAEATGPQLVQLDSPVISDDMLQIQYRGAELKLPASVDIDAVAALLHSIQAL